MKKIDRRFFLKSTAAGASMLPFLQYYACSTPSVPLPFMGGLTAIAVLDDCAECAVRHRLVTDKAAGLLHADIDLGLPANASRMGALVTATFDQVNQVIANANEELDHVFDGMSGPEIAEAVKDRRSDAMKKKETIQRKIALMLGWAMAAGVRSILLPLYQKQPAGDVLPSDMQVYHDAFILKQKAALPDLENISVEKIEDLFNCVNPRMIARTHTLTPDYDDGDGWTVRISNWRDDNKKLVQRFARALVQPDDAAVKKYITGPNFYDQNDPVLQLVTAGKPAPKSECQAAIQSGENASLYGQCVAKGLEDLQILEI